MKEEDLIEALRGLKTQLEFYQEIGVEFLLSPAEPEKPSQKPSQGLIELSSLPESASEDPAEWEALIKKILSCRFCPLYKTRTQAVPGEGNRKAKLMFVGEAPGRDEDLQGRPFVGRAGQLLTKIIQAMGFSRDEVYIANVIKCRPPENRTPKPDEIKACSPYLLKQIELIRPKVIVALGKVAAEFLLQTSKSMSEIRGSFGEFQGIPVMPTFHPSYLVRNEG
ncbi:MAG: uracil-DNA glycosylase, partial [Candidatus Saccharicenans sp.]